MKVYRVKYEQDETGLWVASVAEVAGCHTQGRTVAAARRRIREALPLFVRGAFRLEDDVVLPAALGRDLEAARLKLDQAVHAQREARKAMARIAGELTRGMGIGDAGRILRLSPAAVAKLARSRRRGASA